MRCYCSVYNGFFLIRIKVLSQLPRNRNEIPQIQSLAMNFQKKTGIKLAINFIRYLNSLIDVIHFQVIIYVQGIAVLV